MLVISGAFTVLLGLVVDGGRILDARIAASRAAAQTARVGADSLSAASVREGHDAINVEAARARAQNYLRDTGLTGTVTVSGRTVTVTVTGKSSTLILGFIGIESFPITETETAQAITEEDLP
jgi:Flp pilus assembly protein TadG